MARKKQMQLWTTWKDMRFFDNREYRGYYRLSKDIMDDLYEDEDEVLEWGDVINEYQPVMTPKGLQLIRKEGFK